jgi:hypothetical protein
MYVRVDSSPVFASVLSHAEVGHAAVAWLSGGRSGGESAVAPVEGSNSQAHDIKNKLGLFHYIRISAILSLVWDDDAVQFE